MEKSPENKEAPSRLETRPADRKVDERTARALGRAAVNGANQK